ncbi:hypothetical protein [Paraferrimonas sedimenticola]|uniref:Uncharacterized protein n=1 Tax=Paraferrimonas sedimenticola TaxID=375674 RepID=A0AA37RRQ1_9GAMM|nr:hypothetical protein [Paraferrimonas sedimenticola]GLP95138.1 hypothetical protein GCM10007895_04440 [Paraferrimonas sedimenticola]
MTPFEISRIETKSGTYRLAGHYDLSGKSLSVEFTSAEFMGTDGWVAIAVNSKKGQKRLQGIMPDVLLHLEV